MSTLTANDLKTADLLALARLDDDGPSPADPARPRRPRLDADSIMAGRDIPEAPSPPLIRRQTGDAQAPAVVHPAGTP